MANSTQNETSPCFVIEIPISSTERIFGWLLLMLDGVTFGTLPFSASISVKSSDLAFFGCTLLFLGSVAWFLIYYGLRTVLEKKTWRVIPNSLECQYHGFAGQKTKIYRATAWRIERNSPGGDPIIWFALQPVGARVPVELFAPTFITTSAVEVVELGEKVALITGWPLQIPQELRELKFKDERKL